MANIKAFSFYESYHRALRSLDLEDRKDMMIAIDDYVFENIEPKFKGIKDTIWVLIEPTLRKSKNKAENAIKDKIKSKSNENQKHHDIFNDLSYSYIIYQLSLINIKNESNRDNIINSFKEYIQFRYDNEYSIKESTIKRLVNKLNEYGSNDKQKEQIIGQAIDNGWKDFYPLNEKIKKEEDVIYESV